MWRRTFGLPCTLDQCEHVPGTCLRRSLPTIFQRSFAIGKLLGLQLKMGVGAHPTGTYLHGHLVLASPEFRSHDGDETGPSARGKDEENRNQSWVSLHCDVRRVHGVKPKEGLSWGSLEREKSRNLKYICASSEDGNKNLKNRNFQMKVSTR
jgi:hypothetical protein